MYIYIYIYIYIWIYIYICSFVSWHSAPSACLCLADCSREGHEGFWLCDFALAILCLLRGTRLEELRDVSWRLCLWKVCLLKSSSHEGSVAWRSFSRAKSAAPERAAHLHAWAAFWFADLIAPAFVKSWHKGSELAWLVRLMFGSSVQAGAPQWENTGIRKFELSLLRDVAKPWRSCSFDD